VASQGFENGAEAIQVGVIESEVVSAFRAALGNRGKGLKGTDRADGWVWCMSGPNSAEAFRAYARSGTRRMGKGDLVLVHCNSHVNGLWTDITRTFCLSEPDERQRRIYGAVMSAYETALSAIRAGVGAAQVDGAARSVLEAHGFGKQFKHARGHGVGFSAISHHSRPRLHPASPDILETGMVFNIEPAVYIGGYGGAGQCNLIVLTEKGTEVLTPFQQTIESLMVGR